ncbi:MAG: hypothetical protein NZM37_05485 [Sandaracinaceae bacterium]|nr:hypothetical protein [Sandaracinaceae bacterium]MDW8246535.1 hypothetical protein [Sandaracinaceae bacterium]
MPFLPDAPMPDAWGGGGSPDASHRDSGVDAWRPDAFMGRDSGVDAWRPDAFMPRDTGPMACGTWLGITHRIEPLPSSCLPRCERMTRDRILACPSHDSMAYWNCVDMHLRADRRPSAWVWVGANLIEIVCGDCFYVQLFHCWSLVCPTESIDLFTCNPMSDPDECRGEGDGLDACLRLLSFSQSQQVDMCIHMRLWNACFSL